MEFYNAVVETALLPKVEETPLQPVAPEYLQVLRWNWRITAVVSLAAMAAAWYFIPFLHSQQWAIILGSGWFVITAFRWLWIALSFKRKAYAMRQHDIIYRSGWIIQETQVCPFNRIQHCSVSSGLFETRFGLASLSLYTAGTNEADFTVHGLDEATAITIRDFILQKIAPAGNEQS